MKIRINNVEGRKYTSTKLKETLYEIVLWSPNVYYNKEKEYLGNGYVESFGGEFLSKNGHSISKSFFKSPETCYVIAHLELNEREPDVNLKSIGSRLLDLTDDEINDFLLVYKTINKKIMKKHFKIQ